MPQILRIGPYSIYFWSNENNPLEPILFVISQNVHDMILLASKD